jgi:hypothetical protein
MSEHRRKLSASKGPSIRVETLTQGHSTLVVITRMVYRERVLRVANTSRMVAQARIELATPASSGLRSTTELPGHVWSIENGMI